MTILATERTSEMSVVTPGFGTQDDPQKEVIQMTTATATDLDFIISSNHDGVTLRVRPSAFDRAIMRLSVAMLRWARNHAERSFRSWDELALNNRNALEREAREQASGLGPLRIL